MEKATPSVSVIIPSYNMGNYVGRAIDSVINGNFKDLELIIIDDGSSDNTTAVVAPYVNPKCVEYDPRVSYVHQPNNGKASAVNQGLKVAKGRYVTILDADDEFTPDSIATRFPATQADTEAQPDMIIGGFEVFDKRGTLGTRNEPLVQDAALLKRRLLMSYKTPFSLNTCLISRQLISRVGEFDVQLERCQDIDYSLRCLGNTTSISIAPAIVYRYRKHRTSIINRLRFRYKTALHRPRVVWKNVAGPSRLLLIPYGLGMDMAKMAFEIAGNYKR